MKGGTTMYFAFSFVNVSNKDQRMHYFTLLLTFFGWARSSDVVLWGVPPDEILIYQPNEMFVCKDRQMTIPYKNLNDNYCDCKDGSDEPSTPACPQGVFYCLNEGYLGHLIPSNRVNDGFCDCCDGSDEYSSTNCIDNCANEFEKLKADEGEPEDAKDEKEDGPKTVIGAHKVHMGTRKQEEKMEILRKLQKGMTIEATNDTDKISRNDIEHNGERTAEDGYAQEAFNSLDLNQDGILDVEEVKKEEIFDLNGNMVVEDREVKWYYDAMPGIANQDLFRMKMWEKMGRLYILEKKLDEAVKFEFSMGTLESSGKVEEERTNSKRSAPTSPAPIVGKIADMDDNIDMDDTLDELDDDTKRMVKQALEAREKLNFAQEKLAQVKIEKEKAEETVFETDPDDEDTAEGTAERFGNREHGKYSSHKMHCFRYNTNEFLYRMCPFHRCTQSPKSEQGMVIDLGRWVGWGKENGEPIMVFKNGDHCDKIGSKRSAVVKIYCGSRNLLVHVEETQLCRYRMEFKSPAGCHFRNLKKANFTYTSHDEL